MLFLSPSFLTWVWAKHDNISPKAKEYKKIDLYEELKYYNLRRKYVASVSCLRKTKTTKKEIAHKDLHKKYKIKHYFNPLVVNEYCAMYVWMDQSVDRYTTSTCAATILHSLNRFEMIVSSRMSMRVRVSDYVSGTRTSLSK